MTHARLDLLNALDALTRPTTYRRGTDTRERPPILAQLRAAIVSSASTGGGKTLPNERIPIDPRAMETYGRIARDIRLAHAGLAGRSSDRHPEDLLRAWHVAFLHTNPEDAYIDGWTARINDWVAEVQRILDPPRTLELIDTPCIICGHAEAVNGDGDMQAAIVIEYRRTPEELVADVRAMCRACRAVWEGKHGAESFMRYAEEQAGQVQPFTVDVPDGRGLKHDGALNIAREAFAEAGQLHGRIRVTHTPKPHAPWWTFTADLRDAEAEDGRMQA